MWGCWHTVPQGESGHHIGQFGHIKRSRHGDGPLEVAAAPWTQKQQHLYFNSTNTPVITLCGDPVQFDLKKFFLKKQTWRCVKYTSPVSRVSEFCCDVAVELAESVLSTGPLTCGSIVQQHKVNVRTTEVYVLMSHLYPVCWQRQTVRLPQIMHDFSLFTISSHDDKGRRTWISFSRYK